MRPLMLAVVAWVLATVAVAPPPSPPPPTPPQQVAQHVQPMQGLKRAVAVIGPASGSQVRGVVWFEERADGVRVVADMENLPPDSVHGFHVHEYGDLTKDDGTSAGGHYNPEKHPHGLPTQPHRHAGDLGNVRSDAQGRAHYEAVVAGISVAGATNPIIGRSVVVHDKPDDGSQPAGNAGARIGVGVIGVANPSSEASTARVNTESQT